MSFFTPASFRTQGGSGDRHPRSVILSLLALLATILTVGAIALPNAASAHNREKTSDPAEGEVLTVAPTKITFWFKTAVGEDSITALLIEPSGTRSPLTILSAGDSQVVVALPPLPDGVYSVRWKLISTDGHPVTNKVTFTVAAGVAATTTTSVVGDTIQPSAAPPSSLFTAPTSVFTAPTSVLVVPSPEVGSMAATAAPVAVADVAQQADVDEVGGAPNWLRWLLRFGSYAAIFALIGVLATALFVWPDALQRANLRRTVFLSALAVALLALVQLLVLANDIGSGSWFASLMKVRSFDIGVALIVRIALAVAVIVVAIRSYARVQTVNRVLMALSIGLLATWSYAGHARSQRWPALGIPLDIAHHAAAATWVGALGIVGFVALTQIAGTTLSNVIQRLSQTAFIAVLAVIGSGVIQSIRLNGSSNPFAQGHSRFLVAKVFIVGAMLVLANSNRKATASLVSAPSETHNARATRLRRMIGIEFVLGLFAIAITASLVVRVPAVSDAAFVLFTSTLNY
jgi:putative copper export protein/methionine-rich copper-binding protein CopC